MWQGKKVIKGAPYWYDTPFDKLDFEWSPEEKLMIERFCNRIHKNIEEEGGMTPKERVDALLWGKDKDRMVMCAQTLTTYITRTLDSHTDAIKPVDAYKYPKIWVLAHLATVARYGLDYANFHNINYAEDMWGGQSIIIDYGNPIIEPPMPIKTEEDIEGMTVPDPMKDGLYPGYLWANREYRRILDEYNLPLPVWASICPGPDLLVMMGMVGWMEYPLFLRKKPDLIRKCQDIGNEFIIRLGKAVIDLCAPEAIYM